MSKDRIYLCNLTGSKHLVLPYSCGVLQAFAETVDPDLNSQYVYENYLFHTLNGVEAEAEKIIDPAILGLSLYGWNWNRSRKLAKIIKERYPECLVIVGGPHVPDNIENWLNENPMFDIAVHSEGEITWSKIIREFQLSGPKKFNYESIDGISWNYRGETVTNKSGEKLGKQIDYISPYLAGYFNENIKECNLLNVPTIAVWETNRGCPYSCTFCDWGSYTNQKLRYMDEKRLDAEIEFFGSNINEIHVADANFGILPRDVEIAKKLADQKYSKGTLKKVHASFAKNNKDRVLEIVKILHNYKMTEGGASLSLQSMNDDVLKVIKRSNISLQAYADLQRALNELQIPNYTELILGLPEETTTSFLDTIERIVDLDPSDLRVYPLKLFPNAEISTKETREKYKIHTALWDLNASPEFPDEKELIETVVATRDITHKDMKKLKRLTELIDVLHLGRWTYYLSRYIRDKSNMPIGKFYWKLVNNYWNDETTVIGKLLSNWYFKNYNSGETTGFVGPFSPYDIKWRRGFFRKPTFQWLCISLERDKFYLEIEESLKSWNLWSDDISAVLNFQRELIIDFDYDPSIGKQIILDYDLVDYFKNNKKELTKLESAIIYDISDTKIGNDLIAIKTKDPDTMLRVAGGDRLYVAKGHHFCHKISDMQVKA